MKPLKLRIVRVDMDGYNGREFHPSRSDEGLTVIVTSAQMWSWDASEQVQVTDPLPPEDDRLYIFEVRTEDGRTLELIEHEVEWVS